MEKKGLISPVVKTKQMFQFILTAIPIIRVYLFCQLYLQPIAFLQRAKTPTTTTNNNKCPGHDIKQSVGEAKVMLELWGMLSTPSLSLILGPLVPKVEEPERIFYLWTE